MSSHTKETSSAAAESGGSNTAPCTEAAVSEAFADSAAPGAMSDVNSAASHPGTSAESVDMPAPPSTAGLPPAAVALATRLFDAARHGDDALLRQALEGGLKPNMTNGKGDSLVGQLSTSFLTVRVMACVTATTSVILAHFHCLPICTNCFSAYMYLFTRFPFSADAST
jgi:hypothetical protein